MSSRSGGASNKKKASTASGSGSGTNLNRDMKSQQLNSDHRGGEGNNGFTPLESRTIEVRDSDGCVKQVAALDKRWAPSMNYIEFYLPSCKTLLEDEASLLTWLDYMEMYSKDLKWLLTVPHNQFWSVIVHSPEVPQIVLQSFLLRAPQWFDKEFQIYLDHEVIGPKYREIYSLVFRVFMRLCTFKESKQDYITPITWTSLLTDHQIIDVLKLQTFCCLYDSESNTILPKMIENVMKNCPKFTACFRNLIPILLSKSEEITEELKKRIRESNATHEWDIDVYEEILSFFMSTTCGLYKFAKVYTPVAEIIMKFPNALMKLAVTYEPNCCKLWSQVNSHLPSLGDRIMLLRILLIRLFRVGLANSTIMQVTSSNDQRIDEYFEVLTNCLDEKTFIRDYEKTYPFKQDVNTLLSRGVFIDETRIDYIANAISSCFHACGEDYAVEKIVVDPLYDPNFDRQLLGACSLDVTGPELTSLVSQVKDILPELVDTYVEAVLKHYGYQAEVAINALLEGSVPSRLEKYKDESYFQATSSYLPPADMHGEFDPISMASGELLKMARLEIKDVELDGEKFFPGKRRHGFENSGKSNQADEMVDLKPKIKDLITQMHQEPTRDTNPTRGKKSSKFDPEEDQRQGHYIDESLLPSFREALEYEDEYDDTYDQLNVGMTEPDNVECKPLNQKKMQAAGYADDEDDEEEDNQGVKKLDLYEDPAIVRARMERRRADKMQHHGHNRRGGGPPPTHDVVGKAKGQGQEKDVVYARRQKNINKDSGGFKKKRADFKRRVLILSSFSRLVANFVIKMYRMMFLVKLLILPSLHVNLT